MRILRLALALLLTLQLMACAKSRIVADDYEGDKRWEEVEMQLPEYPRPQNYLPFKVTAESPFDFFVDAKSISVGTDGVVRYALIAKSQNGAINVSYEGIRCSERQVRVYAYGRSDSTWSRARASSWHAVSSDARNAQQLVLYKDFFCPGRGRIVTAEEGIRALRSGVHPLVAPSVSGGE